ncbi:hypothetical protein O1611_g999 [Lasiodiplodia mahajangana]|uniref:Uncharacterized protein n=1 Tax=Lasiodiplodia mahajangana TaxID=1108764 RepID=A0ACC2JZ86_9PEZI|nr:hypothetical protein O1611_g999 [Lasiodiplodia mahajangana]
MAQQRYKQPRATFCTTRHCPGQYGPDRYCEEHSTIAARQRTWKKEWKAKRVASGACVYCNTALSPEERSQGNKVAERQAAGLCGYCGDRQSPGTNRQTCNNCIVKERNRKKALVYAGLCNRCGAKADPDRKTCSRCRDVRNAYVRQKKSKATSTKISKGKNYYPGSGDTITNSI